MTGSYWVETLGCPKNQVDSDKLIGTLAADGLTQADAVADADVVVVNTCAFVEQARQESVDTILEADSVRKPGSELVVTGCMAERYGDELAEALPEVSKVAPFGVSVQLGPTRDGTVRSSFDLLELPRPPASAPWAYVKIAEGCDRNCGFCSIPSFRGKQRSRTIEAIVEEVERLQVSEAVLVAQDLAAYGRDQGQGTRSIVPLFKKVNELVRWVRLLYIYPSDLTDELVEAICSSEVAYFDLSLQHVSPPLMRRMRRWGSADKFTERIDHIRRLRSDAAFRSNFIVGYPGETEADHDALVDFVTEVRLDWCGFFPFSNEDGTYASTLDGHVPTSLAAERLAELTDLQDRITAERRDELIGRSCTVLVDRPGVARSMREAPEIDGTIAVDADLRVGRFAEVAITASNGPDLVAT